jgi:predicted enzyme related to lactoylglutathione lyase
MKVTQPLVGRPCYAELSTSDTAAAGRFYAALFGWTAETDPRPEAQGYGTLSLGGDVIAGLSPLMTPEQPIGWTMSIGVTDADATIEAVSKAGGMVMMEPMDVFDLGRFAFVADPTGAAFSLWQARSHPGSERIDEDGALVWSELATRDMKSARDFYTTVFGWTATDADMGDGEVYTQWGLGGEDFGGMMDMADHYPAEVPPNWLLYFGVPDVDATVAKAQELGGTIIVPASDIPDTGRFACIQDPQGAVLSVYKSVRA